MSERREKEKRRLERMEQSIVAEIKATRPPPAWKESSLFWGWIGIAMGILLLVMPSSFRVFLFVVMWLCFSAACWIAFRECELKRRRVGTTISSLLIGIFVFVLWAYTEVEPVAQLSVECDKQFLTVQQKDRPAPPRATRFARIKVTNIGKRSVGNVKVAVVRTDDQDYQLLQLPVEAMDTLLIVSNPSLVVSANLNPGESQHFHVFIECNGSVCTKGQLAIPHIEGRSRFFVTPFEVGNHSEQREVTVRASGDAVSAVTKTCVILQSPAGHLLMEPKLDK
jgi:hypothetical protein